MKARGELLRRAAWMRALLVALWCATIVASQLIDRTVADRRIVAAFLVACGAALWFAEYRWSRSLLRGRP